MPSHFFDENKVMAELNEDVLRSFRVAKQPSSTEKVSSIDFSLYGDTMISGDSFDQILVYDCDTSIVLKTVNVRKYGVDLVRSTRNPDQFIHTSTKVDHKIRNMNVCGEKERYLDYYDGHTDRVTTLSMSQTDEKFLSASLDGTLRLWDIRSTDNKGIMNVSGQPIASFDPEGRIFAVGINSSFIKLYDVRMFENGPFISNDISVDEGEKWVDLKFSPDGRVIMINTNGSILRLLDAYSLDVSRTIPGRLNATGATMEASFTPDSQFILSGCTDGLVHIWNADTGVKVGFLNRDSRKVPEFLIFNKKYMMFATADTAVSIWLPTI